MAASREPRKQTWNAEGFVKQGIDSCEINANVSSEIRTSLLANRYHEPVLDVCYLGCVLFLLCPVLILFSLSCSCCVLFLILFSLCSFCCVLFLLCPGFAVSYFCYVLLLPIAFNFCTG